MRKPAIALVCVVTLAACEREAGERRETERSISIISLDTTTTGASAAAADNGVDDPIPNGAPPAAGTPVADSLRAALDRRVRGAASDAGEEFSWFSGRTADVIRSVTVDESGHAVVDFVDLRGVIPNASSSAGSQQLLDELNATVFSVGGVRSVEYRMNGDCELLGAWLQYGVCLRFDRPR